MNDSHTINLVTHEFQAENGQAVKLVYEQETDILDIYFGTNEAAMGIELTDQILLRLNRAEKRAISLTIRHFSILTEQTEYGPRSYRLDNLMTMPEELRDLVLTILTSPPVNQFLKLTHFQNAPNERIPFTYVESRPLLVAA
ncbi:MAG TPA: DUF2283 domain-containing protein [Caldilineaceae bacterium]|nr:DUF2283 domain-containing protein [Caldilineaceae bacterium]